MTNIIKLIFKLNLKVMELKKNMNELKTHMKQFV